MPLDYSIQVDGDLLLVTTRGFDENVDKAVSYGEAIIKNCIENNCSRMPVEERKMTAALDAVSQFQMVQRLKSLVQYELSIALVTNIDHYQ